MKRIFLATAAIIFLSIIGSVQADSIGPKENSYRAYPPSCLADPLSISPSGPSWSVTMNVIALNQITHMNTFEAVTFTFWREPCSSSTSAFRGLFERSPQNTGRSDVMPMFPQLTISQGGKVGTVRLGTEPNTVRSMMFPSTLTPVSVPLVFENLPSATAPQFDFSQEFTLTIDPNSPSLPISSGVIPAYDSSQYANANLPLSISGYLTGNWYDPTHSGEGIQTEVGERVNSSGRFITVAWYTFDDLGIPFWLFGAGEFTAGDRSVTLDLGFGTDGGFAGDFGPRTTNHPWGSITLQFPDCKTVSFTYRANAGLPTGVPHGTGSKTWTRLIGINGLNCN